ncbi:MAG: saccharopine dehydrogenase C-terminal domain-containing protein, partial [Puia sp.]
FLGLFENDPLPPRHFTSADILQQLIEGKWKMKAGDRDLIVMLHELDYTVNKKKYSLKSSLVVKGEDHVRTAMAKTVGLPLGISARLILEDKMHVKGLHIPIIPEIYQPVLKELNAQGIRFIDTVS